MSRGVLLVTGGSRGSARRSHDPPPQRDGRSASPTATTRRRPPTVAAGIEADGGVAVSVRADVSVEDDVLAAFAAADSLGPLTALVANAGIVGATGRSTS